jgi:hypothetical protein
LQVFIDSKIFPGYAPTYVFLWPFIRSGSCYPPNEILIYYLPRHLAIDLAMLVFPTPGGPCSKIAFAKY